MHKTFIIEQCKRYKYIHREESEDLRADENSQWVITHNKGHELLMDDFLAFIEGRSVFNRKANKKWLRKNIKRVNQLIEGLDEKYNYFENDEMMTEEDEEIYNINAGMACMAKSLIKTINKRAYISRL